MKEPLSLVTELEIVLLCFCGDVACVIEEVVLG